VRKDRAPDDFGYNGYGVHYLHVIMYGPGWDWTQSPSSQGPKRIAGLARPADTIMIADAQQNKGPNTGWGWPAIYCIVEYPSGITWHQEVGVDKTWALSDRHNEGGSFIFADGHVKWMRWQAVATWSRTRGQELWGHYD
jgi:prepilin-type processing-associated H-X9-DG protein